MIKIEWINEFNTVAGDDWGGVYNETGFAQIGAVFDHEVEFAIGCIYKWYIYILKIKINCI